METWLKWLGAVFPFVNMVILLYLLWRVFHDREKGGDAR